ncbi:hypothetical protein R3P38DRAFT_3484110 [Favolaschia claudopus]|uniref:Uncharacterized protein n=1 Tax=Favolaschia claudopus TaxID=2862362 RepID=A0AAW0CBM8_9AGAR
MDASPPAYTTPNPPSINALPNSREAPPAYSIPATFTIGGRSARPFVTAAQIKAHLALLHAFAELKSSVESNNFAGVPHVPTEKEQRWAWFVGLAVERFERWCIALPENGDYTVLPPVDVLMVWHAYSLNPGWYAEDGVRVEALQELHEAGRGIASALGPGLVQMLSNLPSEKRANNWLEMTSTPFDYFESASQMTTRAVSCPKCQAVTYAPYLNRNGTGYLQQKFEIQCAKQSCGYAITREGLAVRKLVNDLSRTTRGVRDLIAGTLHTSTNVQDTTRGKLAKGTMLSAATMKRPAGSARGTVVSDAAYADINMERSRYKMDRLKALITAKMKNKGGRLINRVLSAYVDDKIFSVELVGAASRTILRQGSFVTKMHELEWTKPGFFDNAEDEIALQHAIARYHAFLDLMSSSPASFFVPTLDIDLVWHTHQLMAEDYANDTMRYVGRFVDHDDKVEESQLANAFDITCGAWKKRFGIQYTHCGCPLPGDTVGQRLSRLVGHGSNPSYLVPPNRDDLLAATHPSDHNAVYAFHHKAKSEAARRKRRAQIAKRQKRDAISGRRTRAPHDPAFLVPVPMYYYSQSAGGCVGASGSVVDGGVGGGNCATVNFFCPFPGGGCGGGGGGGGGGCGGGGGGGCGGGGGGGS